MTRRLLLGAFLFHPGGSHVSGWRHASAEPHRHVDIEYYARFAQTAERGVFDTIFLADGLYFWDRFASGVDHYGQTRLEPLTLLSALAVRTGSVRSMLRGSGTTAAGFDSPARRNSNRPSTAVGVLPVFWMRAVACTPFTSMSSTSAPRSTGSMYT